MALIETLTIASPIVAAASALFAGYSASIAKKSLAVSRLVAQSTYESTTAASTPIITLILDSLTCRSPMAPESENWLLDAEARRWAADEDSDQLEVVIEGRVVNNTDHEVLLTCRDHPQSGRTVWYDYRNQSTFAVDGKKVHLGNSIIPARAEVDLIWTDRRAKMEWAIIYARNERHGIPSWPTLRHYMKLRNVHSGFVLVCESRAQQRVATVWQADIRHPPVRTGGRDDKNQLYYEDRIESFSGPLDDALVHYRFRSNSALALIEKKRRIILPGRAP